ncbi:MAG: RICIN domain-containing protein [Lachnoclostridium sp.]|nr:RICIN domain-containing protein [Lachnospira sp.]MCM1247471.1 RICIN domain-containing protein [Lachnoclostridium sp.]
MAVLLSLEIIFSVILADYMPVAAADLYRLPYSESNIAAVGQQGSNQCMAYALAYCRTILDGYTHAGNEYWQAGIGGMYSWAGYMVSGASSKQGVLRIVYDQINGGKPVCMYVTGHYRSNSAYYAPGDHWVAVVGYRQGANPNSLTESDFYIIDPVRCNGDWLSDGCMPADKYSTGLRISESGGGTTPSSPVTNSPIFTNVSAEEITATSAKIKADYQRDTYGDIGFYFGTSRELSGMTKVSEYKYSNVTTTTTYGNSYQVGVYYDATYGYKWWPALTPGTTYYYAFYCTKNGIEHISNIQTFTTTGGSSAFPLVDNGIYKICSVLSNQVIEVSSGSSQNSKQLNVWPCEGEGDAWMRWKAVRHSDGYSFVNVGTGKAMDIAGGSTQEEAAVTQYDYVAADEQRFRLVDKGNGKYGMLNIHSGLAVDVYDASASPGAKLVQYAFHGGDNQLWYFELIDTTAPVISNVRVSDVDATGYTVSCDVTDDVGVARVDFPTWTTLNGQDDLSKDWPSVTSPAYGNTYSYRVNISDHNNETGSYITHIYAYDAAGNYANEGTSATIKEPVQEPVKQPVTSITGVINCRVSGNTQMTIQLLDAGGKEIAQTKVSGNGLEYALEDVAAGTYTLRVSKTNCVSRDYKITLGGEPLEQDVELCLVGDTSKDGKISVQDNRMVYNHIAGIKQLEGYDFLVGDVNGDGKISVQDNRMVYNHIAGIKKLW